MSKKLLLISLRDNFLDNDRVMPPIGTMSLQSYMLECGIDSTLENDFDLDNIEKYKNYTHIGIFCMTPQKQDAYNILEIIKAKYPNIKVIIGGPHTKFYLKECKKSSFDYIVLGDGEIALKKIMQNKSELSQVLDCQITETEMNLFPIPYRNPDFIKQYNGSPEKTTVLKKQIAPYGHSNFVWKKLDQKLTKHNHQSLMTLIHSGWPLSSNHEEYVPFLYAATLSGHRYPLILRIFTMAELNTAIVVIRFLPLTDSLQRCPPKG